MSNKKNNSKNFDKKEFQKSEPIFNILEARQKIEIMSQNIRLKNAGINPKDKTNAQIIFAKYLDAIKETDKIAKREEVKALNYLLHDFNNAEIRILSTDFAQFLPIIKPSKDETARNIEYEAAAALHTRLTIIQKEREKGANPMSNNEQMATASALSQARYNINNMKPYSRFEKFCEHMKEKIFNHPELITSREPILCPAKLPQQSRNL